MKLNKVDYITVSWVFSFILVMGLKKFFKIESAWFYLLVLPAFLPSHLISGAFLDLLDQLSSKFSSKPKDIQNFYKELDSFIAELKESKFEHYSTKLHSLVHEIAWTTGTELVEELKIVFKELDNEKLPKELKIKLKILRSDANHFGL